MRRKRTLLIVLACLLAAGAAFFAVTWKPKKERVDRFLAAAARFEQQGDRESAIICYRNALKLAPRRGDIHLRLARAYRDTNAPDQCLKHYDAAVRFGMDSNHFLREYADACLRFNAHDELQTPARLLLERLPSDPDAHLWMARALAEEHPDEALLEAEKSLALRADADAYLLVADLNARAKNYTKAENLLREALGRFPDNPALHTALASTLVALDENEEASKLIERALELSAGAPAEERAPVLAVAAHTLGRMGDHERSIELYEELVKLKPQSSLAKQSLAFAYLSAGKGTGAAAFLEKELKARPNDNRLILAYAEALIAVQRHREALEWLDKVSGRDAHSASANYLKGAAHLASGDVWRAEPLLREAVELAPGRTLARLALGICYWRMGQQQSAEAEFRAVLKNEPDNDHAAVWLARCRLAANDPTEAEGLLRRVVEKDQPNTEARALLADCLAQKGDVKAVRKLQPKGMPSSQQRLTLARAHIMSGNMDDALEELHQALREDPDLAAAVVLQAKIHQLNGDLEKAERGLASFVAEHPDSVPAATEYAHLLARMGRPGEGLKVLQALAERLPESPQVYAVLGRYYANNSKTNEAVDALRKAVRLDASSLEPRRRLVELLIADEQYDAAGRELKEMAERFGEVLAVAALEGRLLMAEGKTDEALACFMTVVGRWPKEAEAHLLAGAAYVVKNDMASAISEFQKARDLAPRDVRVRSALRDAYLLVGKFSEAAAEAKAVLELRPGGPADVHRLAMSLAGARQTGQAAEVLRRLVSNAPGIPRYHLQLASLLMSEGKVDEAEEQVKQALEVDRSAATLWGACSFYWSAKRADAARELIETTTDDPELYHSLLARHHAVTGDTERAEAELKEVIRLAPDDARPLAALGDFYAAQPDRQADAAEAYQKALQKEPDNAYAKRRMAVLLARSGKLNDAEKLLAALARKHPHDEAVNLRLAEVAIEWMRLMPGRKATDAALRRCGELVAAFPHSAHAHFLLALAHFSSRPSAPNKSLDELQRALDINPDHTRARELRADVYRALGRNEDAESECRTLLEKQPNSLGAMLMLGEMMQRRQAPGKEFRKLAARFPGNRASKLVLAMATYADDPAKARALADEALGDAPDWQMLKAYAAFLAAHGAADDAARRLEAFISENPKSADAHRTLASVRAAAGDLAAAAESRRKAYVLGGFACDDLQTLVAVLMKDGRAEKAVAVVAEHLERRPDDTAATLLLARLYGRLNRVRDTIELLTDLLEKEPDNTQAHLVIGTAYLVRKQYDDAVRHYEAVLKDAPSNITAANNLAYILAEYKDMPREAERVLLPALQRFPASASAQDTWGWIQYKLGRLAEARAALDESLRLEPDEPLTNYHAAVVCNRLGEKARARELLQRALTLDAGFEHADHARRLLDDLP